MYMMSSVFCVFKQKTTYEMRISDWSSDVCSSDLSDAVEPRIENGRVALIPEIGAALAAFAEAGFLAAHHDADLGGLQLPWTIQQAAFAHFKAANTPTIAYAFLTIAAANLIQAHGSAEQKRLWMAPMLDGRFFGTMALSEPHAGSSLSDVRTAARPVGGDRYAVKGAKMWTSGGEHELSRNIVHMTLARIEGAAPGVKIGQAACRERGWSYVKNPEDAVSYKTTTNTNGQT